MANIANPPQYPVGLFADRPAAEAGLRALQETGFPNEQLSLVPQSLNPNPPIEETEAVRSAAGGALAGTMLGATVGLLLGVISMQLTPEPISMGSLIAVVLAGSGIGAAGTSLIAGLSGASVNKAEAEPEKSRMTQGYLILAAGGQSELQQAKQILQQHGSQMP